MPRVLVNIHEEKMRLLLLFIKLKGIKRKLAYSFCVSIVSLLRISEQEQTTGLYRLYRS